MNDLLHAINDAGLTPPAEIIPDGTLKRFASNGNPSDLSGWYVSFPDGGGFGGCWRTFGDKIGFKVSPAGFDAWAEDRKNEYREKAKQAQNKAKAERERDHAEAAVKANQIWESAAPVTSHPYLEKKQVKPHEIRITGKTLILPIMDTAGKIQSLQSIDPAGNKKFLPGSKISGGFMVIGSRDFTNGGFICEGYATGCSIHEATGKPVVVAFNSGNLPKVAEIFKDHPLTICADNDLGTFEKSGKNPGVDAARKAAEVSGLPVIISPVDSDFNDFHVMRGLDAVREALKPEKTGDTAAAGAEEWEPEISAWPELDPQTLRGIAGDFVELATRKSEADPSAVLITFLIRMGVEIGRNPFVCIGDKKHRLNLMAVVVGETSKSRKGTSAAPIGTLFSHLIRTFCNTQDAENKLNSLSSLSSHRVAKKTPGPLSSGEGLVWAVRDPIQTWVIDKKSKRGEWQTTDPGIEDKRLYVEDQEFASALKCTKRDGNTLATTVRCLWDDGNASPLTKTSKASTTGAHIGIVTHITREELLKSLDEVEAFSGFANRFLWFCARRQGFEPFPEPMPENKLHAITGRVYEIIRFYHEETEIRFTNKTKDLWGRVYQDLSMGYSGLIGGVLNRAEAQVIRLSLLYACLDQSMTIEPGHLQAALALWQYVERSAFYIFGDKMDPTEQKIIVLLEEGPKTATEIYKAFKNHIGKKTLEAAIKSLLVSSKIKLEEIPTAGRPKRTFKLSEKSEEREKNQKSNSYDAKKVRKKCEKRGGNEKINVSNGCGGGSGNDDTVIF